MPFKYATLIDRIIANSVQSLDQFYNGTPCWIWTGKQIKSAERGTVYGGITRRITKGPRKGKVTTELVHRVVITGIKGRRLNKNVKVMHLCNTTLCCNPAHLLGGTQKANVRQAVREGRHGNAYSAPVRDMLDERLAATRTVSLNTKIQQIAALAGTQDVNAWETGFIERLVKLTDDGKKTFAVTEPMIDVIERIWKRHFA